MIGLWTAGSCALDSSTSGLDFLDFCRVQPFLKTWTLYICLSQHNIFVKNYECEQVKTSSIIIQPQIRIVLYQREILFSLTPQNVFCKVYYTYLVFCILECSSNNGLWTLGLALELYVASFAKRTVHKRHNNWQTLNTYCMFVDTWSLIGTDWFWGFFLSSIEYFPICLLRILSFLMLSLHQFCHLVFVVLCFYLFLQWQCPLLVIPRWRPDWVRP